MTKLNYEQKVLTLPIASQSNLGPVRNLIVLVPSFETDLNIVTQKVWGLASAAEAHVIFLGLCHDPEQEPSLRRRLVTMTSIVNYDNVSAEAEIVFGRDWVDAVRSRWQPGDTIVCFAEQRAGLLQKPLSQILRSDMDVPLYILSGPYPQKDSHFNLTTQAAVWIGFIAIAVGFFVLQAGIELQSKDWARTALLLLSVAFELWVIQLWNRLFE